MLRVLVHVERRGAAAGFDRGQHRLQVVLVRDVVLFAGKRAAREFIVPVPFRVLLLGVEPVEVPPALRRELLAKVKVVHHVRHVHALGVKRMRLGRRRDP